MLAANGGAWRTRRLQHGVVSSRKRPSRSRFEMAGAVGSMGWGVGEFIGVGGSFSFSGTNGTNPLYIRGVLSLSHLAAGHLSFVPFMSRLSRSD